jgi:site-specific DNA-methyltransferase (adenine-specific)
MILWNKDLKKIRMSSSSFGGETPISIWKGDSMELLETIPDNTIDLVLTDPPYFIDKLDNHWNSKKLSENTPNSHIRHLPKGMKFDKNQVKTLYDFYLEVSRILWKKMKPGAYFLSFSSPRLYHSIAMACEIAGFEIRDMINWTYTQSMPKAMSMNHVIEKLGLPDEQKIALKETYAGFKTPMLKSCFEPVCVAMKPIGKSTFLQNELEFHTGLLDFSQTVGKGNDRVPANIITTEEFHDVYNKNFLVSKPSREEKGKENHHLTVKPLHLIEHLVRLFSKQGSLVVDPFLGSGTTALACRNTGRRCIGIERDPEYYAIASTRLGSP